MFHSRYNFHIIYIYNYLISGCSFIVSRLNYHSMILLTPSTSSIFDDKVLPLCKSIINTPLLFNELYKLLIALSNSVIYFK